jgi:hypothetical protein
LDPSFRPAIDKRCAAHEAAQSQLRVSASAAVLYNHFDRVIRLAIRSHYKDHC